ncbi:MAG: cd36 [Marteilia pararefringens]
MVSMRSASRLLTAAVWCCLATFVLVAIVVPTVVRYQLVLRKGSLPYSSYVAPPIVSKMRIFVFHVANMADYDSSDENFVPQFEEIGPIVYNMTRLRKNVKQNGRFITSQVLDTYKYNAELSAIDEEHLVSTVNLKNYVASLARKKPLLDTIKLRALLWDPDVGLLKDAGDQLQKPVTVNSGTLNPLSVYKILDIDGKIKGPFGNGCNRFDGSYEGVGFSPLPYDVKLYFEPFGRNIDLTWTNYRYGVAKYLFDKDSFNMKLKKNKCYNQLEKYDGAMQLPDIDSNMNPALISFPHFLYSKDKRLTEIIGMHPDKGKHIGFFDIEPMSGVPTAGAIRLQINILSNHDTVLPVIWTEITFELDEDMKTKLKFVHFLLLVLPVTVSGCFICVLIAYLCHVHRIYQRRKVGYVMM